MKYILQILFFICFISGQSNYAKKTIPQNWPESLWNTCWKENYVDFTEEQWIKLLPEMQENFSKSYQEWYVKEKNYAYIEKIFKINGIPLVMSFIPPGKYLQGFSKEEPFYNYDDQKVILIKKPFWCGKFEITQKQWETIMGYNPSYFFYDENLPVEKVTWNEVKKFCELTNSQLLEENEWEYACKAGVNYQYLGNYAEKLEKFCWFESNSSDKTHPVGQKDPNSWGLYDMQGNVWEWCKDIFVKNTPSIKKNDSSNFYVVRGGSWNAFAEYCLPSFRFWYSENTSYHALGFRIKIDILD